MAVQKPSIPKGTRDFLPSEMVKRTYIFDTIKKVFQKYGYLPIETPAMEKLETLLGKYGDEGDKLLFKILNSGNFLKDAQIVELPEESNKLAMQISGKGLRYDLTVPFARFVVQYRNDITFPFKRYQIQPVWRADRPQKGRYQEFYQCDADVIGSKSLLNEAELLQIIDEVFGSLKIKVLIKLNNRKILAGIADYINCPDRITDITVALDKLDKIGKENVIAELAGRGIPDRSIALLQPVMEIEGSAKDKTVFLKKLLAGSEIGAEGIKETEVLFGYVESLNMSSAVELDLTLARGLNYYTGAIIEVKARDVEIGSICGGGRYDDLTGIFGMPDVSGVGISFGADRIYDVMNQLNLFPGTVITSTKILFVNFGKTEAAYCLKVLNDLRKQDISGELYPDAVKLKKQMDYANARNIKFVALAGENEIPKGKVTLKNMDSGEQQLYSADDLVKILKQ
ncbi:MAG: histidine--tRNA ligase [Bacteroidales bacterium]|nr:histidine--tRNA ligase [Bacteroidales bacterium]